MSDTITVKEFFTEHPAGKKVIHLLAKKVEKFGKQRCEESAWTYLLLSQALNAIGEYFSVGSDMSFFDGDSWANTLLNKDILKAKPSEVVDEIMNWALSDDEAPDIFSTDDDTVLVARRCILGDFVEDRYTP